MTIVLRCLWFVVGCSYWLWIGWCWLGEFVCCGCSIVYLFCWCVAGDFPCWRELVLTIVGFRFVFYGVVVCLCVFGVAGFVFDGRIVGWLFRRV